MKPALLALLALAVPCSAAAGSLRLSGGKKSENALRRFIRDDARLKARFEDAARREEAFLAENRESDLRDAVADFPVSRRDLISSLPGMKAAPAPTCATLASCPTPDLADDAPDAESLPEAVRRLVRPWMLLQEARGSTLELIPADGAGDAALIVRLRDLDAEPLVVNVTPKLLGGFKVWLDQPLALAALYGRERDAVIKTSK